MMMPEIHNSSSMLMGYHNHFQIRFSHHERRRIEFILIIWHQRKVERENKRKKIAHYILLFK